MLIAILAPDSQSEYCTNSSWRFRISGWEAADLDTLQPYLDSDMQSRWFDFGGDTVVRADSYVLESPTYGSSFD